MATYAVRRLGVAPCTESTYKTMIEREVLVKKGDDKALAEFDAKQKAKLEKKEGGDK